MDKKTITAENIIAIIINGAQTNRYSEFRDESGNISIKEYIINNNLEISSHHYSSGNPISRPIQFICCEFNSAINISHFTNINGLSFNNCIFENQVSLSSSVGNIIINECIIKDGITINSDKTSELILSNSKIKGNISISGTFRTHIKISEINSIDYEQDCQELSFSRASIKKLTLGKVYAKFITINSNSNLEHEALIENIYTQSLTINTTKIGLLLHLKSCNIDTFLVDNIGEGATKHRHLRISDDCRFTNATFPLEMLDNTRIADSVFVKIRLWGTNTDNSIFIIENVLFVELFFDEVHNKGTIAIKDLSHLSIGSLISLNSSNLGKTDFIHSQLSKAILRFKNSKLTEIFISDTDFPKLVYGIDGYKVDPVQAKLAFSQLHTALSKQGDTVRALEYQSREIAAHYQTLRWFSWKRPLFNFTKFNLWLNWISNNYGRDWVLGGLFTIGAGLLFYILLLISTDRYQFGIPHIDWNLLPGFLKFMNPIRFFDLELLFKNDDKFSSLRFSPWSYLWDFLGRIFLAYGFYQTIQAFRRYGRK